MSDTPLTDAFEKTLDETAFMTDASLRPMLDFARQLERELNKERAARPDRVPGACSE